MERLKNRADYIISRNKEYAKHSLIVNWSICGLCIVNLIVSIIVLLAGSYIGQYIISANIFAVIILVIFNISWNKCRQNLNRTFYDYINKMEGKENENISSR